MLRKRLKTHSGAGCDKRKGPDQVGRKRDDATCRRMSGKLPVSRCYLIEAFIAESRATVPGKTSASASAHALVFSHCHSHTYIRTLSLSLYLALPRALASNAAELCTRALLCLACRDSTARAYRAISCAARYARIIAFCFVLVILNRKPCAGALCMCACAIGQLRAALEATPGTFDL